MIEYPFIAVIHFNYWESIPLMILITPKLRDYPFTEYKLKIINGTFSAYIMLWKHRQNDQKLFLKKAYDRKGT